MPEEDRSKFLKMAGVVFALVIVIVLGTMIYACNTGGSPQNDETMPGGGDDDVTYVAPVRPPMLA